MTNSALTSPALQINLAWLYAAVAVGGGLICSTGSGWPWPRPEPAEAERHLAIARGNYMLLAVNRYRLRRPHRIVVADCLRARHRGGCRA